MQYLAASLRRSAKLLQPAFSNNFNRSPWNWSGIVEACWLDGRSYATSMFEIGQGHSSSCKFMQDDPQHHSEHKVTESLEVRQDNQALDQYSPSKAGLPRKKDIGRNISSRDKNTFLHKTLSDLKDSKEAVYGALDAWVAWESSFPLVRLKRVLFTLEKEGQWHRVIQVIKWMLSKGQGTTMGTYAQLIRALEKGHRAEEAHKLWLKKIGHDLHSVPWQVCDLMISIYYRNDMLERLVKLFKGLESFDRKPPSKSIVQKVADAYEMLGLLEEKNKVLDKYSGLFCKSTIELQRKSRRASKKIEKNADGSKERSSGSSEAGSGSHTENVETEIVG